jgi:hypothetical protein
MDNIGIDFGEKELERNYGLVWLRIGTSGGLLLIR